MKNSITTRALNFILLLSLAIILFALACVALKNDRNVIAATNNEISSDPSAVSLTM